MVGRDRVLGFFGEFMGSVSPDLRFVIDDISGEDPSAVGVTWHLEWKGRPFPFSRGCSFYRCQPDPNQQDRIQIVYGRDCVEPATKPGELALVAIRGVTWILERFSSLACASLRQGLSEPRSGRWRTSSTSGPAPTTTCCCRRGRLRPAAAREGPTLVVACGWDTISYSRSQASGCCENEFLLINSSGAWLAARHKAERGDQRVASLPPNFHAQANRPGAQAALPQHEVRDCGYESREVAEEKWRRHRRKKWRNFLVITTLLLFMVGYVLYFI